MRNVFITAVAMLLLTCGFVYSQESKTQTECKSGTCQVMGFHSPSRCHK